MQLWQVIKDINVKDIAELSHSFLPVIVIFAQPHFFQKVAPQQKSLLFHQSRLEHSFDDAMKALKVPISTLLPTQPGENSTQIPPHGIYLFSCPTKPNMSSLYIPTYPLDIISISTLIRMPPFGQFPFTEDRIAKKLFKFQDRVNPFMFSNVVDYCFGTLFGLFVVIESLVETRQIYERQEVQNGSVVTR